MNLKDALEVADDALFDKTGKRLTDIQKVILRGSLENKAYREIEEIDNYNEQHIKNEGANLWKLLSKALGEKVTKKSCLVTLERYQRSLHKPKENLPSIPKSVRSTSLPEEVNILVQDVRKKVRNKIEERCSTMRVLDMAHPIDICDIYTDVNILEKISGSRRFEISEIQKLFTPESDNFERYGLSQIEERISGIKAVNNYPRLMILGKPGSGKTTFLKNLALRCIWGEFQANRVPIFITLKEFAETLSQPELLKYIKNLLSDTEVDESQINLLLKHGRVLILLDGLDEVREEDTNRVLNQIKYFSNEFFLSDYYLEDKNTFIEKSNIISQRIDKLTETINSNKESLEELEEEESKLYDDLNKYKNKIVFKIEYTQTQQKLVFNKTKITSIKGVIEDIEEQIKRLKIEKEKDYPDISRQQEKLLKFLSERNPEKHYSNHFVITCRIAAQDFKFDKFTEVEVADFTDEQIKHFSKNWFTLQKKLEQGNNFIQKLWENKPVKELASNPLLLTLLCLVFEELAKFPNNRAELYEEGVDILLKKWDSGRNIDRGEVYKELSTLRKENLLSQIAFITFDSKNYFFNQADAEKYIKNYISNILDPETDEETLNLDSAGVLKSIEAQHGLLVERARNIYSFSHLTFHEYFAAKYIVDTSNPHKLEKGLKNLASHITEKRWREVFLLAIRLLNQADCLIESMKEKIDLLVAEDKNLQNILTWVRNSSSSIKLPYNETAIRAFYLIRAYDIAIANTYKSDLSDILERSFDNTLISILDRNFCIDKLIGARSFGYTLFQIHRRARGRTFNSEFVTALANVNSDIFSIILDSEQYVKFQEIKKEIPATNDKRFSNWVVTNMNFLLEKLNIIVKSPNIVHNFTLNNQQEEKFRQYYNANMFLLECLNSDCYMDHLVRKKILDNLFLPFEDIGTNILIG